MVKQNTCEQTKARQAQVELKKKVFIHIKNNKMSNVTNKMGP